MTNEREAGQDSGELLVRYATAMALDGDRATASAGTTRSWSGCMTDGDIARRRPRTLHMHAI